MHIETHSFSSSEKLINLNKCPYLLHVEHILTAHSGYENSMKMITHSSQNRTAKHNTRVYFIYPPKAFLPEFTYYKPCMIMYFFESAMKAQPSDVKSCLPSLQRSANL